MKYLFILQIVVYFSLPQYVFAARLVDLQCDRLTNYEESFFDKIRNLFVKNIEPKYETVTLAKGLREGHTKFSSKNGLRPSVIFYDLQLEKFISTIDQKSHYIPLKYFMDGQLTVPGCIKSIEYGRTGIID